MLGTKEKDTRTLSLKAPAKLNLSLRVVGRRVDGYHLLDSLMVPIGVFDRLRISVSEEAAEAVRLITCGEPTIRPEDNLALRAAKLFLERTSRSSCVEIDLEKHIPIGSGMGGGSSDAAAVLWGLDELLETGVGVDKLAEWGLEIGADVPFFVHGHPARVRGVGEVVDDLPERLDLPLVVAFGGNGLPTAEVYHAYDGALTNPEVPSNKSVSADPQVPLHEWLVNDLEAAASQIEPGIRLLKQRLLDLGARAALMTGTGAAVFGVWKDVQGAQAAAAKLQVEGVWSRAVEILDRRPETRED